MTWVLLIFGFRYKHLGPLKKWNLLYKFDFYSGPIPGFISLQMYVIFSLLWISRNRWHHPPRSWPPYLFVLTLTTARRKRSKPGYADNKWLHWSFKLQEFQYLKCCDHVLFFKKCVFSTSMITTIVLKSRFWNSYCDQYCQNIWDQWKDSF